jgi:hypothetical protein
MQMKRRKRALACLDLAAAPAQVPFEIRLASVFTPDLEDQGQIV